MRNFGSSCGISAMPISEGTEVGVIFLSPGNDGIFRPFSAPIYGRYDVDGCLENIRHDENSELMETFFNLDIDTIIDAVGSTQNIYSEFNPLFEAFYDRKYNFRNWDATVAEKLSGMRFILDFTGHYVYGDYSVKYKKKPYEDEDNVYSYTIVNNRTGVTLSNLEVSDFGDFLAIFAEVSGHFLGFRAEGRQALRTIPTLRNMFIIKDIFDGMADYMETVQTSREYLQEESDTWKELKGLFALSGEGVEDEQSVISHHHRILDSNGYKDFSKLIGFPRGKIDLWAAQEGDYFMELVLLEHVLTSVNRTFYPSSHVTHHDGIEATTKMLDLSKKFLKRDAKTAKVHD